MNKEKSEAELRAEFDKIFTIYYEKKQEFASVEITREDAHERNEKFQKHMRDALELCRLQKILSDLSRQIHEAKV